jgi:hypothetical protein
VVTEWTPVAGDKARREVNKRRRHFNISKTGFVSQLGNDATYSSPFLRFLRKATSAPSVWSLWALGELTVRYAFTDYWNAWKV